VSSKGKNLSVSPTLEERKGVLGSAGSGKEGEMIHSFSKGRGRVKGNVFRQARK